MNFKDMNSLKELKERHIDFGFRRKGRRKKIKTINVSQDIWAKLVYVRFNCPELSDYEKLSWDNFFEKILEDIDMDLPDS